MTNVEIVLNNLFSLSAEELELVIDICQTQLKEQNDPMFNLYPMNLDTELETVE